MHPQILLCVLAAGVSALPQIVERETITKNYTTSGQISVYTEDGSKVGCLEETGKATSNTDTCATFSSRYITGYDDNGFVRISNYTLTTTKGFCGVTYHDGDDPSLNHNRGHVWECREDMPLYEPPSTGYSSVQYQEGANAMISHLEVISGLGGDSSEWNTVGGVALSSVPAIMQARQTAYPLGPIFVFVPEFEPTV